MIATATKTIPERELTAYHEAGHAICCAQLGGQVLQVDIRHNPYFDRGGVCRYRPPAFIPARIAIMLGGPLAERWRAGANHFDSKGWGDFQNIDQYLSAKYHEPTERHETGEYADALILARGILGNHWGALAHLAKYLLAHETASGQLVDAITAAIS